jgi:hypothetical protein
MHNNLWRENRNLYLRVLLFMLEDFKLLSPFSTVPSDGPLQKLNSY